MDVMMHANVQIMRSFRMRKWIQPVAVERKLKLSFQVAALAKSLIAVKRIVEQRRNYGEKDNVIMSQESGEKIYLKPNGRG
eukprot:2076355-Karenia_brevis.AAC.1